MDELQFKTVPVFLEWYVHTVLFLIQNISQTNSSITRIYFLEVTHLLISKRRLNLGTFEK